MDKMLTVYSLAESELVHELIAGFQTMYPGVEIRYETGEAGLSAFEQADALTARLMAGNGPDVLIMDGLPANTYQNRGFLADLSPALASVREELQQNILSAYETDGGSFMLPVRYSVPVAVVKKQNAEVVGSLNKLMRYSGLQRGGVCAWGYSRKDFVELVYYNYTPEFILPDGSADEQDIRRESIELGNFLIWTKWLLENEKVKAGNQEHTYFTEGENTIGLFREEVELMFMPLSRMGQLRFYNPCVLAAGYGNIRYGATSLQLMDGIFFPEGLLGINAQSENRELAEQFVKAAFSFEMQSEYTAETGFQTNGRALTEAFLAQQEENQRMLESGGTKDTVRHMTEQRGTVERMFGAITSVKRPQTVNPAILEVLQEEAQDYFDGEEYLWDCVAAILERVQ
ncbi:MAG: extracellular solute-binding protein [Lachnospiraceae bacterium]|nr:extracellular solute-binding protein [Lachnospiraceae bacterium]